MKLKVFTAVCLSALFMVGTQGTQAAAMKKTAKSVEVPLSFEKQLSPIEKALSQQKRDRSAKKSIDENDQIKIVLKEKRTFKMFKKNAVIRVYAPKSFNKDFIII